MADNITQIQLGVPGVSLVSGNITVNNTTSNVTAALSVLNGLVQVPVTINSAVVDPSTGQVTILGSSLLGAVSVGLNENGNVATVQVGALPVVNTAIVVTCYCSGTLIRTTRGEIAAENLAVGDIVVTASGEERAIRWIGRRDYAGRFANSNPDLLPVCIKADAIAEGVPARNLWVSPRHALYIDGVLIPAEALLNGVTVVKAERVDSLTYWHVELESHDIILAENMPSESFVDDNGRSLFHNAASFDALYPDAVKAEAVYCAPRVESGHTVEGVRRRIAARAGLVTSAPKFGALRGRVETCDGAIVSGWAQDELYPDAPVCLDILVDGELVALTYADQPRPELEAASLVTGNHGFELRLPLSPTGSHKVEVRRSADGTALDGSPLLVPGRMAHAA